MSREFELIEKYFAKLTYPQFHVIAGIGDDSAVIEPLANECLLTTTDTLVENTHFFEDTSSEALGYKSLAVSLSDMAAMGATPRWVTMSLTFPTIDEKWLASFCEGFNLMAIRHDVALVGGDLNAGPLSVTVQVMGTAPREKILYRHGAQVGDRIYVTGFLGASAAAVWLRKQNRSVPPVLQRDLDYPEPQVTWGKVLGGVAHSAIDVSDGLLADVGHMMKASQTQALLYYDVLPVCATLEETVGKSEARNFALTGGDDYQLCFTLPRERDSWVERQVELLDEGVGVTCIGEVQKGSGLLLIDSCKNIVDLPERKGYSHWST